MKNREKNIKAAVGLLLFFMYATTCLQAQSFRTVLDKRMSKAIEKLDCQLPDEQNPVSINTTLVKGKKSDDMTVVIKVLMAPDWHIYAYVPTEMPYLTTEFILHLPEGVMAEGTWEKSSPSASISDEGVFIYEEEAIFIHRLKVKKGSKGVIEVGLSYQSCNLWQCLPPTKKIFKLEME